MTDDFRDWAKERLLASKKIGPELTDAFLLNIDELPEEKSGTTLGQLIVEKKLGKGLVVTSKHPRNVLVNMKGVFTGSAATVISILGGIAPWAGALLGLVAVGQFMNDMKIELGESHAKVVLWLWDEKRQSSWVHKSELVEAFSGDLKPQPLEQVLEDLRKLRAIEFKEEDGSIWKNEYLVIKSSAGI